MSTPEEHAGEPGIIKSGIRIETNSKGMAQVKVSVYDGVDEAEVQRLMDLAVKAYETVIARLGARANY